MVAVEGYVDVIAMSLAGFPHVVAGLGTALTADQCELLWKMAEEPILCFDGDKAGRKAAFRALDTALPLIGPGRSLRFALLPEGQDPDDLARSGGREALESVLASARPLVEMLFLREAEAQALDTPERRAGLERRLREAASQIRDETLRRHYFDDLRDRLGQLFGRSRAPAHGSTNGGFQRNGRFGRKVEPALAARAELGAAAIEPVRRAQRGPGAARKPHSGSIDQPSDPARPPCRGYRPARLRQRFGPEAA